MGVRNIKMLKSGTLFHSTEIVIFVNSMTTISVSEETRRNLLRYASRLQLATGKKVDFDEAIKNLLGREKRPDLLDEACKPIPNSDRLVQDLYNERRKDDEILERHVRG